MILVELEIEDYKQFRGSHRFTPSPDGVIAIIGHNGAGKTTLFEAIEWCLYQPREIAADEVPPRGQAAKPRVKMTLQDPNTGARYVVARWLSKSRVADAEIYRDDESDERIVKGSRQTTEHVSRTLIGLGHRAFVSTFFTRQKELTFFGDMKETERRREVGRLLGMETIRDAQKLIGDERTELHSQAKSLELQYQESTQNRDFAAESEGAEARVIETGTAVESAESALSAAEQNHQRARAELERLSALEREDAALRTEMERLRGGVRAAEARRDAAISEIGRIEEAAEERLRLDHVAVELDTRRLAVAAHDLAREQFQARRRLESDLARAQSKRTEATGELRTTVMNARAGDVSGWAWRSRDEDSPVDAAQRLIEIAASLDLDGAQARVEAFTRFGQLVDQHDQIARMLQKMKDFLEHLNGELAGHTAQGDPKNERARLEHEREQTLKLVHESGSRLKTIEDEIGRLEPIQRRLRAQEAGTICPTCGRPIDAHDIEVTLSVFAERLEPLERERESINQDRPRWLKQVSSLDEAIQVATQRASQIDVLRGRIDSGMQKIADSEEELKLKTAELAEQLRALNMSAAPTQREIERARSELSTRQRVANAGQLLQRIETSLRQAIADELCLTSDLTAIGPIAYDQDAHELARAALSEAEQATARIAQIDLLLVRKPERQREVDQADGEIGSLGRSLEERNAKLAELAFDPTALESAQEHEARVIVEERTARDHRAASEAARVEAIRFREALTVEHERIAKLIERSESRAREAGQLDLMYREFNVFEQFVADRLTPQLSDYTSELLNVITDGKYDRVEFTNNYGVEVFDGDDEKFPVEEFSGGERDVIALCARLALSRLIGSQANNPPGFMVLDEVFGSLDRERRAQVLETLGALGGTADAFHQLFIISHVDDVRSSPIFNEVWRVSEGADGISHLENLNLTGGFDDA